MVMGKGHWQCHKCSKSNAPRDPNAEGIYEDFGENSSEEEGGLSTDGQPRKTKPRCNGELPDRTRCTSTTTTNSIKALASP
jgi:hypothetical protein